MADPDRAITSRVAVVVPTRNRRHLLGQALGGLRGQSRPPDEIVVVSDGSTDGTDELVETLPIRLVRTSGVGSAGARNAGWKATEGDLIAFLDDDCVPDADWLSRLLAPFDDPRVGLVQGRTRPARALDVGERSISVETETGLYESCNIAYRRTALQEVDGFDESFTRRFGPFGEDTDLAWRVKRLGWESRFNSDAVVSHDVSAQSLGDLVRAEWRRGLFPDLVRLIPELRPRMARPPWFLRRHSPLAQLLVLSLVLAPRRRAALLLTLPYWWWLARNRPPRGMPRQVLGDLVASVALLRGSVRARRILL
ncbi:MAG TPA: glycosyltransferase [Acidimicrobiales bacterium]|nr:glycosyltransferase [Acidimicrobiales bacterium]